MIKTRQTNSDTFVNFNSPIAFTFPLINTVSMSAQTSFKVGLSRIFSKSRGSSGGQKELSVPKWKVLNILITLKHTFVSGNLREMHEVLHICAHLVYWTSLSITHQIKIFQTRILETIIYGLLDPGGVVPWELCRHENICTWYTRSTNCIPNGVLSSCFTLHLSIYPRP